MDKISVLEWLMIIFNLTSLIIIWSLLLWHGWSFQVGRDGEGGFKIWSRPLKRFFKKKKEGENA